MKKGYLLFIILFAVIIFFPPIAHESHLQVINNDTANHLMVFEKIKNNNPSFNYLGQAVVGYPLVYIEKFTGINIKTLFMWTNYIVMFLGGITIAALVIIISRSWLGGMLSAILIVFGIGSTQHLFWSGTTFNIQNFLIIFPLLLISIYMYVKSKKHWWIPIIISISTLMFFYHPSLGIGIRFLGTAPDMPSASIETRATQFNEGIISPIISIPIFFGISNILLLIYCIYIKDKFRTVKEKLIGMEYKVIIYIVCGLTLGMLALSTFHSSIFSSRMAINGCLALGIFLCLCIGTALSKIKKKIAIVPIILLVIISVLPNLINWFTQASLYNPERGMY